MKKSIMILIIVTTGFVCFGQQDSVYTGPLNSTGTKNNLTQANENGSINKSTSTHHNVLHEFTYLVAMRDYCDKTLVQMRANGEVNKKVSKQLKKELSKTRAELASSKFNGLKIEPGLYEVFLKQINDRKEWQKK
jgi:hypothetical protein